MFPMMYTTGSDYGLIALWGLHVLSVVAFFTGVVFLVVIAIKNFNTVQLRNWAVWLMIAGTIVCLFTIAVIGRPWFGFMGNRNAGMSGMEMMGMGRMMEEMYGDSERGDGMGMSMNGMSAMLEGKTGDDFDKAFIEMMIPHHQGAIDMAQAALERAKHGQIREMAADIIASQQGEIDQMRQWHQEWGYAQ